MKNLSCVNADGKSLTLEGGKISSLGDADLRGFRFSGSAGEQSFDGNFVECLFQDMYFDCVDFARCDWKDCRVQSTHFFKCNLSNSSIITNVFSYCTFEKCSFEDTGISHCEFKSCQFFQCNLSHIITKSSLFETVSFMKCETSNRIIESSVLLNCDFASTDIEIGLITGNFGLFHAKVLDCNLFVRSDNKEKKLIPWQNLTNDEFLNSLSILEKFSVSFFLYGLDAENADIIDLALDPSNWIRNARIAASFGAMASNFSKFLLWLYKNNNAPITYILLYHTGNFKFMKFVEEKEPELSLYQTLAGVHLSLTREVDIYISALRSLQNYFSSKKVIHFLANGPLDADYYKNLLADFQIEGVKVEDVRPRNSPVDLSLFFPSAKVLTPILALFLAGSTRVDLIKYSKVIDSQQTGDESEGKAGKKLIHFHAGLSRENAGSYELDITTILPHSLLFSLNIQFKTSIIHKFRNFIVGLLTQDHNEPKSNKGNSNPNLPKEL